MTGLPPYRNGVRVVAYWPDGIRIDVKGHGGFDITAADFADDDKLAGSIARSGISVSVEQVRAAA